MFRLSLSLFGVSFASIATPCGVARSLCALDFLSVTSRRLGPAPRLRLEMNPLSFRSIDPLIGVFCCPPGGGEPVACVAPSMDVFWR